ncbi:MAG: leucine-rich repeat protein [Kiritimatiellae bacterium]|nr:leucine-rich repeat protein [Kiritimatiellia bacterium]
MKKQIVRSAAALVLAVATSAALQSYGDEDRWYDSAQKISWGFSVTNGEATISTPGFWDSNARDIVKGDIVVPSRIGPDGPDGTTAYPVRDMKTGLFRNCVNVKSVTLPDGMRRVADNAFYFDSGSTLTNVVIGTGCLDIGENAFCRCHSLVCVNIPDTVTNIAYSAFTMCRALPRIDIPGSVKTVGDSAFSACSVLEAATFGDGVELIAADAFMGCGKLAVVDLPASVKSIGERAFSGCNALGTCTLREGLESIGNFAFSSCESLTNVLIPVSVTRVGDSAFQYCPDSLFDQETIQGISLLSGWAVAVNNPSGQVDLFGVDGVADGLFKGQRYVTSVTLSPGIESLGHGMFMECFELKSVILPAALKEIEGQAFLSCRKLESISFPSGVTNIGAQAFENCEKLAGLALPTNLTVMGDNAFDNCTNVTSLTIPASLKRIPMGAFEWCTGLTNVTVEEGVETIGNAAFYRCTGLSSFTIPDSVKVVEDIAFGSCRFVDTNTIDHVETVDGWIVDADTEKLTDVVVPGDVRGIANNAFDNCRKLTNAVLEAGVARVPAYAFNCATQLAEVSLPDTVTEIGAFAFCNCDSLVEAWVPSNVVAIGERAFASCTALETVYLPVALKGIVNESNLVDGSFNANVCYYNPDGSLVPPPVPGPNPDVETWTVTFNPNGGVFEDAAQASREVEKGTAIGDLPLPVREGHAFDGWWTAKTKGAKITVSTKITKNATYYARWKIRKYKVSATVNSKTMGSVSGAGTKTYKSKVTLKATPKKDCVFVRWEQTGSEDTPWPSVAKFRQPSVSFTLGAANVSVRAVFAKKSTDAAPVLTVTSSDEWYVESEPEREIRIEAEALSYPAVTVKGAPGGIGLVRVADMDDATWILKATDFSKMKPGVYTATITAKNRAGKSASKSVRIIAPNSTAAIDTGLISGLKTSTLDPYMPTGGMKTKWTFADLGMEVFATNGWKLVSVKGLPAGLSWNGSAIVGAAAKTGVYTVTFTMQKKEKKGKTTKTYTSAASATFKVEALFPAELAGTYNGFANTNIVAPEAGEGEGGEGGEGEGGEEEEESVIYKPLMDEWASAAKVTVTAAGKITLNIGGTALSGNGFDSVSNGVYAVTLKKTQKITKGALKGKSKVWEAYIEIDTNMVWSATQLVGCYQTYTTGIPSMAAPAWIAAQRNAFGGNADAKKVADAVAGTRKFNAKSAKDVDWSYNLVAGTALTVKAKANGAVTLAGKIGSTKVSGSSTLEVSAVEMVEVEPDVQPSTVVPRAMVLKCSAECDDPILVARQTATARFFSGKFIVEVFYTLKDGAVDSVSGRAWKK